MLELALKAKMPIIRAHTTDLMNLREVIEFYVPGEKVAEWDRGFPAGAKVIYAVQEYEPARAVYDNFSDSEKTLVLINQGADSPYAFNVGEVPVPHELRVKLLKGVVKASQIDSIAKCFQGLTLKTMGEVIRIASACFGSVTAHTVRSVRSMVAGSQVGLEPVDTELGVYMCPPQLSEWVRVNTPYFVNNVDPKLVPRGLLFSGIPGTGKTQGAKYIAQKFGVPLYRLDMASSLGKYVGQSEANLSKVLATVDKEDNCVLLMDEMEKLFAESDDTGVTSRLLSQILWWLQEHTSRVLTVMTTNDLNKIPKEVYRPGRIDIVMGMLPLNGAQALTLAMGVFKSFNNRSLNSYEAEFKRLLKKDIDVLFGGGKAVAHASVVQLVYSIIKRKEWLL